MPALHESHKYDDIINMPHHVSGSHPQMDIMDRAAQFSPFAALPGYEAAVKEAARLTEQRIELDENEKAILDAKLSLLQKNLSLSPEVTLTYFQPEKQKTGGTYRSVTGKVQKIDTSNKCLILENGKRISASDILKIEF